MAYGRWKDGYDSDDLVLSLVAAFPAMEVWTPFGTSCFCPSTSVPSVVPPTAMDGSEVPTPSEDRDMLMWGNNLHDFVADLMLAGSSEL